MTTAEIVQKLWNLCNVLRDDGITYHQYVTELTYILFLKMAKETGAENKIPKGYRWDDLTSKDGIEMHKFYRELLLKLGTRRQEPSSADLCQRPYQHRRAQEPEEDRQRLSTSWTGTAPGKKVWAICTKVCWRKTPMRRNPAQDSTSPLAR